LFLSGGGTRAAALSYGVMQELARTTLPDGTRMLDTVATISAVSGGCFPAAYYCLYGDRLFADFERRFLKRDVQGALVSRTLSPIGSIRLASDYFARSDLAAEYYDRILFHGATYADLAHGPATRPFLVINATDMDSFAPFPFTQETFSLIGSDLSTVPLSRAVAASSAVPVLLTPITLRNYSGRPPPELAAPAAEGPLDPHDALLTLLAHRYLDAGRYPYIHLLDGGLADNLGLNNLLLALDLAGGWDSLLRDNGAITAAHPQIAIIVVNAATEPETRWSQREETPSLHNIASALSRNAINNASYTLLARVRESLATWRAHAAPGHPEVRLIAIGFDQLSSPEERAFFNKVPTRFSLPDATVDRLIAVGARLLRESPEYQALLTAARKDAR
jgi:NTE family protein